MSNLKVKTDEELIEIVNQYMKDKPHLGRTHIVLHATGCPERVRRLAKEGKINLPKPLPKGANSGWGKYFYIQSRDKIFVR